MDKQPPLLNYVGLLMCTFNRIPSESSLLSTLEIVELLELIQGMASSFPRAQQRYFRETVDELVALAVSYLEKFQLDFGFVGGDG